jgi:hypothetical protein
MTYICVRIYSTVQYMYIYICIVLRLLAFKSQRSTVHQRYDTGLTHFLLQYDTVQYSSIIAFQLSFSNSAELYCTVLHCAVSQIELLCTAMHVHVTVTIQYLLYIACTRRASESEMVQYTY